MKKQQLKKAIVPAGTATKKAIIPTTTKEMYIADGTSASAVLARLIGDGTLANFREAHAIHFEADDTPYSKAAHKKLVTAYKAGKITEAFKDNIVVSCAKILDDSFREANGDYPALDAVLSVNEKSTVQSIIESAFRTEEEVETETIGVPTIPVSDVIKAFLVGNKAAARLLRDGNFLLNEAFVSLMEENEPTGWKTLSGKMSETDIEIAGE